MRQTVLVLKILLVLCFLGVLTLFIVQNYDRTTDISLNLVFWSTHASTPWRLPWLLALTFGLGGFFGTILGFVLRGPSSASDSSYSSGGSSDLDDAWA